MRLKLRPCWICWSAMEIVSWMLGRIGDGIPCLLPAVQASMDLSTLLNPFPALSPIWLKAFMVLVWNP